MSFMNIQLVVLAVIAVFLILKLHSILGSRDGFEPEVKKNKLTPKAAPNLKIVKKTVDQDIADHVDPKSENGLNLDAMKAADLNFSVTEFLNGARNAYETIIMAYLSDDTDHLKPLLSNDVFQVFAQNIASRQSKGRKIEANFIGVRKMKLVNAKFDPTTDTGEITLQFIGELTSVVKNSAGEIIEGNAKIIKQQKDEWTFLRVMHSKDPNWLLVQT